MWLFGIILSKLWPFIWESRDLQKFTFSSYREKNYDAATIVTRRFFYMKTVKIKVIQNFMEITFYIKTYSKRTCWKKFFKFRFWLFFLTFEDEFGFRQWQPGNNHQRIKTKTLCQKLKLKIKCWITFFSKFFQRNS